MRNPRWTWVFFFLLLCLAAAQSHARFSDLEHSHLRSLKGSRDNDSEDDCTERNEECDEDDDCCGGGSVCAPRSLPLECKEFFRSGKSCDERKYEDHDCCDLETVCKQCRVEGGGCIMDDQCCDDMICVYDPKDRKKKYDPKKSYPLGTCEVA